MTTTQADKLKVGDRVVWTGQDGPIHGTVANIPTENEGHYGLAIIREDSGEMSDASLTEGTLLPGSMWKRQDCPAAKLRCCEEMLPGHRDHGLCQRAHGHDGGHCAYDIDDMPGMR